MWRTCPRLSAKTVAQKPGERVMPVSAPGQAAAGAAKAGTTAGPSEAPAASMMATAVAEMAVLRPGCVRRDFMIKLLRTRWRDLGRPQGQLAPNGSVRGVRDHPWSRQACPCRDAVPRGSAFPKHRGRRNPRYRQSARQFLAA